MLKKVISAAAAIAAAVSALSVPTADSLYFATSRYAEYEAELESQGYAVLPEDLGYFERHSQGYGVGEYDRLTAVWTKGNDVDLSQPALENISSWTGGDYSDIVLEIAEADFVCVNLENLAADGQSVVSSLTEDLEISGDTADISFYSLETASYESYGFDTMYISVDFLTEDHESNYETARQIVSYCKQNYSVASAAAQFDVRQFVRGYHYWFNIGDHKYSADHEKLRTAYDYTDEEIAALNAELAENGYRLRFDPEFKQFDFEADVTERERFETEDYLYEKYGWTGGGYFQATTSITGGEFDLMYTDSGDANCDGAVSIADSTAILQYLGNRDKYPLTAQGQFNADIAGDSDGVTAADALAIQALDTAGGLS